jgi:hypothetical protein
MTPGGQEPGPAAEPGRAETYLRLLAEAELRRVQALPRPDPLAAIGVPAPLRGAIRLALPLGNRAVTALQPLAENAARTLQPLAENAARTLQPLADTAARTIQPLASQLAGAVLPAAEQAARRLNPLVWRSASKLRFSGMHQLRTWRERAAPLSPLYRFTSGGPPKRAELSVPEGLRRLGAVAQALAQVGAVDQGTTDAVMASMEAALMARSRIPPGRLWARTWRGRRQQRTGPPPAGVYLAAPLSVPAAAAPDSGLRHVHLVTIVIAPDRALVVMAGQVTEPGDRSVHRDPWPVFGGSGRPAATDDRGNSYQLHEDSGWSGDDGEWDATLRLSPVPPAGTRWLELTIGPDSAPIRVDLAGGGDATPGLQPATSSPAERLIENAATDLLYFAIGDRPDGVAQGARGPRGDLSQVADIVAALEAVGALGAARDAVGRLVTLAGRLGVDIPPVLRAAAPPRGLPAAWASVLENSHRRDGPRGVAPAAAVLPELDRTRFVLAGLRSYPASARLVAMAWGNHHMPGFLEYPGSNPWSWSARDDQGRWHLIFQGRSSASDRHAEFQLILKPPLHPRATSLEVTLAGPSGQVTATVPLDWRQP